MQASIYLDNASSTPTDPEVAAKMTEVMTTAWGNPSAQHPHGVAARRAIAEARQQVLAALGDAAETGDVIWTSGCTESDALALLGAAHAGPGAVVVTTIEHPAVAQNARRLEAGGRTVRRVAPGPDGVLRPQDVAEAAEGARVACIVAVQNELGIVQPFEELAAAIKARAPTCHVHVDAAQAIGKIDVDVARMPADSIALAAHKFHGPTGVGALWLRGGVTLEALWGGGGQQRGLRSGTQHAAGAAGMGAAATLAVARRREATDRWHSFVQVILGVLQHRDVAPVWQVPDSLRVPHILALGFASVSAEALRNTLASRGVSISTGSACATDAGHGSAALAASGFPQDAAMVRLSFGWQTQFSEVEVAAQTLAKVVRELRGK